MIDAGWSGLEVPEHLAGAGASFAETVVVAEELGRAVAAGPFLGTAVLGTAVLGVGALLDAGADDLLRAVAGGETTVAVALAPSGEAALAAPAFRQERGRLHGAARFVVDAPTADRLLLLVEGGELACVAASSVSIRPVPALDESRSFGHVAADGAPVEATWPLRDRQVALDRGALAVAADSLGLAEAMLGVTVEYVKVRHQFDRPIGSFQAVKHACADMRVAVTLSRALLGLAVTALVDGDPDAGRAVAMASSHVCSAAVDVLGSAMQLHGGIGYTWESGIHRYLKRATLNRSLLGSPPAQRRRLAARYAAFS